MFFFIIKNVKNVLKENVLQMYSNYNKYISFMLLKTLIILFLNLNVDSGSTFKTFAFSLPKVKTSAKVLQILVY